MNKETIIPSDRAGERSGYLKVIQTIERGETDAVVLYDARIAISGLPSALVARFIAACQRRSVTICEAKPDGREYDLTIASDELAFRRLADERW